MHKETKNKWFTVLFAATYFVCIAMVSYTLVMEHHSLKWLYTLFPFCLIPAYFTKNYRIRLVSAWLSLLILFGGSIIEPLALDAVEESFIVLPLCYVMLFPGSLWPIAVGVALVLTYLFDLPAQQFDEFVEDAIEVLFITLFATVMTYFQQKSALQALEYKKASLTDPLTTLPNRASFFSDIDAIDVTQSKDYAAIQVGLRQLKRVNDHLGYGYGDELLRQFADLIKATINGDGKVYRLGGDELVILIPFEQGDLQIVQQITKRLHDVNDTICQVHNTSFSLKFSGGVAILSQSHGNIAVWGKNVDAAIADAKMHTDLDIRWYDDELMDRTIRAHQIETELKSAIDNDQLFLHYQPKVDLKTEKIVGAEALLRWRHPDLGLVSPLDFIAIAERTAQIIPIGRWVITQAVQQAKRWQVLGKSVCISVNVSSVQFAHDDIDEFILQTLIQFDLEAKYIQIEITETTLVEKYSRVAEVCQTLRAAGVTIAIDDFGVEYSSLNYLKRLPVDVLKIDKSFVDDCIKHKINHMLVRTIIQMGHNLDKIIVAEGVEDKQQRDLLLAESCNQYQGYYFSRPVAPQDFTELLDSN